METFHSKNQHRKIPKLKSFQNVRKKFEILGLGPDLAMQPYPFNRRLCMGFLLLGFINTFQLMYIFNEAETFAEYTQSIYFCSIFTDGIAQIIVSIFKVHTLYEFIDGTNVALNIGKRKSNRLLLTVTGATLFCSCCFLLSF